MGSPHSDPPSLPLSLSPSLPLSLPCRYVRESRLLRSGEECGPKENESSEEDDFASVQRAVPLRNEGGRPTKFAHRLRSLLRRLGAPNGEDRPHKPWARVVWQRDTSLE